MVEDLDDLLQDLETTYSNDNSRALHQPSEKSDRSELSLDINFILESDIEEKPQKEPRQTAIQSEKIKCCPIYIAGTNIPVGCSNLASTKTCSALHCRNCDFKISHFPNSEWVKDVDYLFLRTNMPHSEKISEKLKRKDGSIAYACQCVAYATAELCSLHSVQSLPWFCRGHTEQC